MLRAKKTGNPAIDATDDATGNGPARALAAVVVGTPHEYIKYHPFGTKHMPARPVFPIDWNGNLTPRCLRKITQKINEAFAKELRKIGFK